MWQANPLRFPWPAASPVEWLPWQSVPAFARQPRPAAVETASQQLDHSVAALVNHSRRFEDLTWNQFQSHLPVYQLSATDQIGKHRRSVCWPEELPLEIPPV